jgi:RHS repeat-associated protein
MHGQGFDPSVAVGVPSTVTHGTEVEHIDLMSGAVIINIPLLHLKGRGLDTDIVATYNSKLWSSRYNEDPYNGWQVFEDFGQGSSMGNGWSVGIPRMLAVETGGQPTDGNNSFINLVQMHRFDGTTIALASPTFYIGPYTGPLFSYDGSYAKQLADGSTVMMANGSRLHWVSYQLPSGAWGATQNLEDTNGNQISCSGSPFPCTDTLGRTISMTTSGTSQMIWYVDSSGISQHIQLNFSTLSVRYPWIGGNTVCGGAQAFNCVWNGGGTANFLSSIVLPNGASYQFEYLDNGDGSTSGELTKLTLPTGGYIRYTYTSQASPGREVYEASNRVIDHRFISPDGTATAEHAWVYNIPASTVTDPQGNVHAETFNASTLGPDVLDGQSFPPLLPVPISIQSKDSDVNGNLLSQTDKIPAYDSSSEYAVQGFSSVNNPRITQITTTLGGSTQQAIKTFSYSSYGNIHEEKDYDWAPAGQVGTLLRTTTSTYLADVTPAYAGDAVHILDRRYSMATSGNCGAATGTCATTTYSYDGYGGGRLQMQLGTTSSIVQHDYATFSSAHTLRGNLTQQVSGPGLNGGSTTTDIGYNDLGDVVAKMDGNENTTTYDYTDQYSGTQPSTATMAFVTKVTKPSTNGVQHLIRASYYLNSGLTASVCGENFPAGSNCAPDLPGTHSDYTWGGYDSINRAIEAHSGDGGSTILIYDDTPLASTVSKVEAMSASQNMYTLVHYDGLGRKYSFEVNDPSGSDFVDTTYDTLGRLQSVTNPYRMYPSPGDPPFGITTFAYDGLGRATMVCNPDNGSTGACIAGNSYRKRVYSGNSTKSYDERQNYWQNTTDALGNLTQVVEPGGLITNYSYDVLGNLSDVNQLGNSTFATVNPDTPRTRHFTYDSLSRLVTARNAEAGTSLATGTVCYGEWSGGIVDSGTCQSRYDANGNLQVKTDPRGITTNFVYDALNRLSSRISSDGTVYDTYAYDDPAAGNNGLGRLMSAANVNMGVLQPDGDNNGQSQYTYDAVGRVASEANYSVDDSGLMRPTVATYDLAGHIHSLTYPSGLTINHSYDGAGNLISITDQGSGTNYLTSATYSPSGAESGTVFANGTTQSFSYNNRLQECRIKAVDSIRSQTLLDKQYYFGSETLCGSAAQDNGNIASIVDGLQPGLTRSFMYDSLNRLTYAARSDGKFNYSYVTDSFGNMNQINNLAGNPAVSFDAHNQMQLSLNGYSYDASGNLTQGGGHNYAYDADNNIISVDNLNTAFFTYDAEGRRDTKFPMAMAPGGFTGWIAYSYFGGQVMEENHSDQDTTDYIYANGKRIAKLDSIVRAEGISGNSCSPSMALPLAADGAIHSGDKYHWHEQHPANVQSVLMVGSTTSSGFFPVEFLASASTDGDWHDVEVDLSNLTYVENPEIALFWIEAGTLEGGDFSSPPSGGWNADVANMTLTTADGNVITALNGSGSASGFPGCPSGSTYYENAYTQPASVSTYYYVGDSLGTTQMLVSSGGWPTWSGEFLPYGQEIDTNFSTNSRRFTGKERDVETGLDYFGARYYGSAMGRFVTPDWSAKAEPVPYAKLGDPQSLNLYAYVSNNPVSNVDPDGHDPSWYDVETNWYGALPHSGLEGHQNRSASGGSTFTMGAMSSDSVDSYDNYLTYVAASEAYAAQGPNNTTGFHTQDEAAKAILAEINPKSIEENVEYAGLIFQDSAGFFHYSEPEPGNEESAFSGIPPKGLTVYGEYHTHADYARPGGPYGRTPIPTDRKHDHYNSDHFSPDDKNRVRDGAAGLNRLWGTNKNPAFRGYLGTPSGRFLVYNPFTKKETDLQ